jgi:hypothetical protein
MAMLAGSLPPRLARAAQPAMSRLEAGGVIPIILLLDHISAAFDADLIVQIAPHADQGPRESWSPQMPMNARWPGRVPTR